MMGLVKSGHTLSPVISSKVYWNVSNNSMLYGVEIWDTSANDIRTLEAAHQCMARTLQGLPRLVAGDGVLLPLGWYSVSAVIYRKRAMFIGKTLNTEFATFPKKIMLNRLVDLRFSGRSGHRLKMTVCGIS
jgi:hypothetical protein